MRKDVRALQRGSKLLGFLAMVAVLPACDSLGQFTGVDRHPATKIADEAERDVEAPDVFSTRETGLWDGRPSLGGVWVAHPDVTAPERVLIRNTQSDTFVVGALFSRERNLPGPRLQISADAADALGMAAGQTAELEVTALRRRLVSQSEAIDEEVIVIDEAGESQVQSAQSEEVADPSAGSLPSNGSVQSTTRPVSPLSKPYVQIGIFSVRANADRVSAQMRSAGILPIIREYERSGKIFWRVIAGPAQTASELARLRDSIAKQGFTDAYAVPN